MHTAHPTRTPRSPGFVLPGALLLAALSTLALVAGCNATALVGATPQRAGAVAAAGAATTTTTATPEAPGFEPVRPFEEMLDVIVPDDDAPQNGASTPS